MTFRSLGRAIVVALTVTAAVEAVYARQFPPPDGWKWVTDSEAKIVTTLDPPEGSWMFGTMAPGWHVTTKPGVILFEPSYAGRARFTVESESFLFPGSSPAGFGVFVGGSDLGEKSRYVAFVIRRDGSAAIEAVEAGKITPLHPWTKTSAVIAGHEKDAVKNLLRVEAEASTVGFFVNGQKVADVPREKGRFEGTVGLRIGADLNIHVTNLDLTHRLALPRPSKSPMRL
jgi:hypothetical protein